MHNNTEQAPDITETDIYFIETYLRQRGNHKALLEIDGLVLREDLAGHEKAMKLQETIQGVLNGR